MINVYVFIDINVIRMWADAQRDGHPAEYRWRLLFNDAKFGWRPIGLLECRAVTLPGGRNRQRVKFRRNQSNRCQNMAIFRFPKMAVVAILDFQSSKFSTVDSFKRVELCRRAKFGRNRRNHCRDGDFSIFQDGGRPPFWICVRVIGPPTKVVGWSLSLCKIWLESMQ